MSGGLAVASSVRHTFVGIRTACLLAFTLSGGLVVSYSSASYIGIRTAGYAHLTRDAAETRSLIPSHSIIHHANLYPSGYPKTNNLRPIQSGLLAAETQMREGIELKFIEPGTQQCNKNSSDAVSKAVVAH